MKKKLTTLLGLLVLIAGLQFIMAPSMSLIGQTYRILVRQGLEADLPTLSTGELGFTTDTRKLYVGSSVGNIAVGIGSDYLGLGTGLTRLGYLAGIADASADLTAYGFQAGKANTTGVRNVFLGYNAGMTNTIGGYNTFVGYYAGHLSLGGIQNTFVGYGAARANVSGNYHTALGFQTLHGSVNASGCTAIGYQAGNANTGGNYATYLGYEAGLVDQANYSVFIGAYAGIANTTGLRNTFIGFQAGSTNVSADNSTFIGDQAGTASTSAGNVGIGSFALGAQTSGAFNVAIGLTAGSGITTQYGNTMVGTEAGKVNAAGYNTFVGFNAGVANTSGTRNTFLGTQAGATETTASDNTFVGYQAGTAASQLMNTALGSYAGFGLTSGGYNTLLGHMAGYGVATGTLNVMLGFQAGYYETGSSKLFIDNDKRASEADARTKSLMYGVFGATTAAQSLAVNGNFSLGPTTFGTNADFVFAQPNGTAPTTSPADAYQQYSANAGGVNGQAGPHFRTEGGGIFAMRSDTGTTLQYVYQKDDLTDDGTVTLPDATSGMVLVSCNGEAGMWLVQADGTVTKISGSTNTAAADTDANLCVYDSGTGATVKNRLGATGEIRIVYYYN